MFAWGASVFLVKKKNKIKYGFKGPVSNVDRGLLLPNY